jgi:hypothetical protein
MKELEENCPSEIFIKGLRPTMTKEHAEQHEPVIEYPKYDVCKALRKWFKQFQGRRYCAVIKHKPSISTKHEKILERRLNMLQSILSLIRFMDKNELSYEPKIKFGKYLKPFEFTINLVTNTDFDCLVCEFMLYVSENSFKSHLNDIKEYFKIAVDLQQKELQAQRKINKTKEEKVQLPEEVANILGNYLPNRT